MSYLNCPRCGDRSYERLQSYSHCVLCDYSPAFGDMERETKALRSVCKYLDSQAVQLRFPAPSKSTAKMAETSSAISNG